MTAPISQKPSLHAKAMHAALRLMRRFGEGLGIAGRILMRSVQRFSDRQATQAAAGMAYYALFALFPLLLFLVAFGSLFVQLDEAQRQVWKMVADLLPVSEDLVLSVLDKVLSFRGGIGAIAGIGLLWSALGFFAILGRNVNLAWPNARARSFLQGRIFAFAMVAVLALLAAVALIGDALIAVIPLISLPLWEDVIALAPLAETLLSELAPIVLPLLLFTVLYSQAPRLHVCWWEAVISAALATFLWRLTTAGFVWFLGSGIISYSLVYGSLGSVMALLFWIYLSSWIVLFGAHLCVEIAVYHRADEINRICQD